MGFLRFPLLFSLVLCWFGLASSHAGNEHEHLVYLPKYSDFLAAGFNPAEIQASSVGTGATFRRILGWQESLELLRASPLSRRLAGLGVAPPEKGVESLLADYIRGKDLGQLSRDIAKIKRCSEQTAVRSLFELNELHAPAERAAAYLAIGNFRTQVLTGMKWKLPRIFENYFKTNPSDAWRTLELSVPPALYDRETLQDLQKIAKNKGSSMRFYMATPREGWVDERAQRNLRKIRISIEEGWGHGADIVGSFSEADGIPKGPGEIAAQRAKFEQLGNSLGTRGALRIHAYEGARQGTFYSALWEFLEQGVEKGTLPPEIRIGHINALKPEDVDHFKRILKKSRKPLSIVFEASIESNLLIRPGGDRDQAIRRLSNTIEQLHDSGFKVVLGSDGQGILGKKSQFLNTLGLLKSNQMKRSSLRRIIDDSSLLDSEKSAALEALKLRPAGVNPARNTCLRRFPL